MTMTRKGMRRSLVVVPSLCVPMITLYEYFTAWPRNDGGASVGIASSNLTAKQKGDDDDDCFYVALFSTLEQTHCAHM